MSPRMRLWVRLTFVQTSDQADIWSEVPTGWGFGLGWHFDRWLIGWPIAAGWLTDHLTTCQPDPPPRIWLWVRLTFCQMTVWVGNCSWLADWPSGMSISSPESDLGLDGHFVRWLVDWPTAVGLLAGWPSDKMSLVYWCKRWTPLQDLTYGSGWHFVRWLVGQLQLAGWPSDKMSLVYWCKRWTSLQDLT